MPNILIENDWQHTSIQHDIILYYYINNNGFEN